MFSNLKLFQNQKFIFKKVFKDKKSKTKEEDEDAMVEDKLGSNSGFSLLKKN